MKVLNKGGLLILTVPNLSFFRVLFWKIFDPKLMSIHNAQATDLKKVKKIIEKYKCTVLYYGRLKEVDLWLENSGGLRGRMGLIIIKIFKIFFRIFRIFPSISSPTCYWIAKKN